MKTLVICPAFNEAANIQAVIHAIREANPDADVLVIDDGSSDGTYELARAAHCRALRLPFNVGVGGAVRLGLLTAYREQYKSAVQCDADGQHPADRIRDLVEALDQADIVIGSRWGADGGFGARGPRKWAMTLLSKSLSALHHTRLTDVTSGFRAFGPDAIAVLSREMPPEYLGDTIDALTIAKSAGLRVTELPVIMAARTTGRPSQNLVRSTLYLSRAALLLALSIGRTLWKKTRRVI